MKRKEGFKSGPSWVYRSAQPQRLQRFRTAGAGPVNATHFFFFIPPNDLIGFFFSQGLAVAPQPQKPAVKSGRCARFRFHFQNQGRGGDSVHKKVSQKENCHHTTTGENSAAAQTDRWAVINNNNMSQ